jgi:DNA-binding LytR/AlgR family response regulator
MTDIVPHASPNAAGNAPDVEAQVTPLAHHRTGFIVAFFAAIFMTFTEALGTGVAGFATRLTYWMIVMLTGATIGAAVTSGVQSWGKLRQHLWAEAALISFLIALPLTLAVIGAGMILLNMQRPSPSGLLMNFGLVVLVSMTITAITYAIELGQKSKATNAPAPIVKESALSDKSTTSKASQILLEQRFRDRLPLHLTNAKLLAVQAEDHYLRVHTDLGDALILMRLSDAIAELIEVPGAQTHRSWWVARDAVTKSSRSDGKALLILTGEIEAPVSRNYLKALNDAGWFR